MAVRQSIPDVGNDIDSQMRALRAIKEALELGQGQPRDARETFATLGRLVDLGYLDLSGQVFSSKKQLYTDLLMNSPWVDYNTFASATEPFNYPGYYRDALGRVYLRGLIANGTSATVIATLPAGFRPQYRHMFDCRGAIVSSSETSLRIDVRPQGMIAFIPAGTVDYVSLDGISFAAYQ